MADGGAVSPVTTEVLQSVGLEDRKLTIEQRVLDSLIADTSQHAATTRRSSRGLSTPFDPLSKFDKAAGHLGRERCRAYFRSTLTAGHGRCDENAFVAFMDKLANFPAQDVLDFFDALDVNNAGELDFDTFHVVVSLYVAYDCMECTRFLAVFGQRMFEILHAPDFDERGVSVERLKLFGRMAGLSEAQLIRTLSACNVKFTDPVNAKDFMTIYTSVFTEFDHWRRTKLKAPDQPRTGCCVIL